LTITIVVLLRHAVRKTVASNTPNNRMQCFKVDPPGR
jgi:hypothetical protein